MTARDRACVQHIRLDFLDGVWDVECFCGWSADTAYDEREDAVREWERHRAAVWPEGEAK